jgi:hypothetical protein
VYSEDIAQVANQRAGDVIAYASSLAMVKRLERGFLGRRAARLEGLSALVGWQARSLAKLGVETGDQAFVQQAELLQTLLENVED